MDLKTLSLALLALSLCAPAAWAGEPAYEQRTVLLSETSAPLTREEAAALFPGPAGDDRIAIAPVIIVMAGAKLWNVIVNGRPSADLASAYASAIPGFQFNWNDMADWKKVTRRYRFKMGNFIQGDDAVDIVYETTFFHGSLATPGSSPLRRGHYIANFVVKPETIKMKWGWKVSLSVLMSNPMNIGTAEEPTALLEADLKWLFAKPFSDEPKIGMETMSVDGLGNLVTSIDGALQLPPVRDDEPAAEIPAISWD
ncbi:MAG: hypothetical protein PHV33_07615 [Elusimicrobiales bacterium]|nr:hypothetical protein [Elusimicrobiales bacterium]